MRILMLGNSFTYYHDMPQILSHLLGCEVVAHTRGGAYLAEQFDPESEMGASTLKALKEEKWDYVVMQEQSNAPALKREAFQSSAKTLCDLIHENGAKPLFYVTWAYREGSGILADTGMTFEEMDKALYDSYHAAAEAGNALTADVGVAFRNVRAQVDVYESDDYHPSSAGSVLAAAVLAAAIKEDQTADLPF